MLLYSGAPRESWFVRVVPGFSESFSVLAHPSSSGPWNPSAHSETSVQQLCVRPPSGNNGRESWKCFAALDVLAGMLVAAADTHSRKVFAHMWQLLGEKKQLRMKIS